ncbi:hypothetical protein OG497_38150 [Streptomyces sp. NBC_01242]|uniref:hypothetical protein n=1 Tax=Streptomyces sp. NBC_01242 TaxID=2903795 RepID=UPI00225A56B3|nr:hypothetical protein [Streptomyces sp. NBC_01242]MCX4799683.1 hypothetical protein [Streptomyces sp. NBC_01242]
MTAITPPSVPFSASGNLLGYVCFEEDADEWRPNNTFSATLRLHDVKRSVSSARFIWRDEADGTLYPMLLPDILDIITAGTISLGVTKGWWIVGQRGRNYGLRRASEAETVVMPFSEQTSDDMACSMPRPHMPHGITHSARAYHCDGTRVSLRHREYDIKGGQSS